ncbi:MAG: hypothetical protein ACLP0B_02880, partial [Steroidobacteraceae bacterium]
MREQRDTETSLESILDQLGRVILGKETQIRLCLACLLARGHLLIEDIPEANCCRKLILSKENW